MTSKSFAAQVADLAAAEMGAEMLPMDMTIIMTDMRTLFNVSLQTRHRDKTEDGLFNTDIIKVPASAISKFMYNLMAYQNVRAKDLLEVRFHLMSEQGLSFTYAYTVKKTSILSARDASSTSAS